MAILTARSRTRIRSAVYSMAWHKGSCKQARFRGRSPWKRTPKPGRRPSCLPFTGPSQPRRALQGQPVSRNSRALIVHLVSNRSVFLSRGFGSAQAFIIERFSVGEIGPCSASTEETEPSFARRTAEGRLSPHEFKRRKLKSQELTAKSYLHGL